MFYKVYKRMCLERGESVTGVARKLGISPNTAATWASGAEPRNSTKLKIAEYFGVPVTVFDEEYSETVDDVDALREELRANPELRTLLSASSKLNTDDLRKVIDIVRAINRE